MNSSKDFFKVINDQQPGSTMMMATVASLFENGDPKLKFDGDTTTSEKHYAYLSSYTPTEGDRVILAAISGTFVILGSVIYNG